jgi:hypothetical protein
MRYQRHASIILLFGPLTVIFVHLIRPLPADLGPAIKWIIGVLPNFAAAVWLPFIIETFRKRIMKSSSWRIFDNFYFLVIAAFLFLILWEAVQLWFWNYPFDKFDILASFVGALAAAALHYCFVRMDRTGPAR